MYTLGGFILFETMMLAKGIDWLAQLSIASDLETRRATLAVFSELQAVYSSERTLHELYFHQHDDKKQLEERVRSVMSDLEERIVKVLIRAGSVTAKREAVVTEGESCFSSRRGDARHCEEIIQCRTHCVPHGSHCVRAHHDHLATAIENLRPRRRDCLVGLSKLTRCLSRHDSR